MSGINNTVILFFFPQLYCASWYYQSFFYLLLHKIIALTLRRLMSYIYDISRPKVNDLTLILLTWRKW